MEAQLKAFLGALKVSKGDLFSHTTKSTKDLENGWPSGTYYVEENYQEDFLTVYCNAIRKGVQPTISERPGAYGPLRVDFDFKCPVDKGLKRAYTFENVRGIVGAYQNLLRDIIEPDAFDEKMLWCILLEKPNARVEDGVVKDGFHLHFPHFVCEGYIQDEYLRDKISKYIIQEKIFEQKNLVTPLSEVVDAGMARKQWLMYGSMNYKNKHSRPYMYNRWDDVPLKNQYGYAFDHDLKEISLDEVFEEEMIGRSNTTRYYLPRFMSIRGYIQPTELIPELEEKRAMTKKKTRKRRQIQQTRSMADVLADLKLIQEAEIMNMISDDRADNYGEWMDVGWTLFNIGQGCDEALEMWLDFSRRSTKYTDGKCEELWASMELRDKSIASLLAMAKMDSPNEYRAWKETNIRFYLWKSIQEPEPNEYDVAMVACKMYGDRFVCAEAKKNVWYEFSGHRWILMDDELTLKGLLVEDVVEKYCELRKELNSDMGDIECKMDCREEGKNELKNEYQDRAEKKKRCSKIIRALKTCQFLNKVVTMCKLKMYDRNFLLKIDENRKLLGCANGVIDLELGVFRDGRPDDYITFSTDVYYQEYREDDEEVEELDEYLLKVYPNENRRKYFVDFMASCLEGGNINKRFLIATGPSDGAKSMTFALLEMVFGVGQTGYFGKFPRELIVQATGRNSSSGPRPELARVRGKRIMGCQEITKMEKMNIGMIKELTGNDSIYTRSLHEKGSEIMPQFTLCMMCNEAPAVPGHDEATWSRIRVLDHESKFVKPSDLKKFPVPKTLAEQLRMKRFKADPAFRARLKDLAPVLLWKLFKTYIKNKGKGLKEPKEVTLATDLYQADNDIYLQFIRERIIREDDEEVAKKTFIRIREVQDEFKEWYRENYPSWSKEQIGKSTLKHEINRRLGIISSETDIYGFNSKNSRWYGYKFVLDEEDAEEVDFNTLLGKKKVKPEDE